MTDSHQSNMNARLKAAAEKWKVPTTFPFYMRGPNYCPIQIDRPDLDVCMDILDKLPRYPNWSMRLADNSKKWTCWCSVFDSAVFGTFIECVLPLSERLSPVTDQEQV